MTGKIRLAIPTTGEGGLRAVVSNVFARAQTFTYVDIVDGEIRDIRVEVNKASGLKHGTGPIVAKTLKDNGVDIVVASDVGPGARTLLDMNGIMVVYAKPRIKVSEAVEKALEDLRNLRAR